MIDLKIHFPKRDMDALFDQMQRAEKEIGKSAYQSIAWAGALVCKSVAAQTKVAPKLRRIVRNPDKRYKTDRRRAPFGVYKYKEGKKEFRPIFRTGEYGKFRFYDKTSASWFERFGENRNQWRKIASGPDIANPEIVVPGIKTDKRRVIGRRGLAKKSWQVLGKFVKRPGGTTAMNVASGRIQWGNDRNYLKISNLLNYAGYALKGDINQAVSRAASSMRNRIDKQIEKNLAKTLG